MKKYTIALSAALMSSVAYSMPIEPGFDLYTTESGLQSIGFDINFLGSQFDQAYINRRGNITFGSPLSSFANDLNQHGQHIIAPFFEGITNQVSSTNITFGSGFFNDYEAYGVNWNDVSGLRSPGKNTFQLLLVNRWDSDDEDTMQGDFDVVFNYGTVQWDKSLLGETARIGFAAPNGTTEDNTMFQLHGAPGTFVTDTGSYALTENRINSDTTGRYVFNFRGGEYIPPVHVPTPSIMFLLGIGCLALCYSIRK